MRPDPDCHLCPLAEGRTSIVMPDGEPGGVVLVGEGPGENEDLQGRPFVGRSGKILEEAMGAAGLSRSDVMITNTVKCRPPGNRDPTAEEMAACRPFLESELASCRLIVGLGLSACRDVAGISGRMSDIANTETTVCMGGREVPFIATYHPAACIYSKAAREGLRITMETVRGRI
jgi:uracil-DNA glycosylase